VLACGIWVDWLCCLQSASGVGIASVVLLGVRKASSFPEMILSSSVHCQYIRHLIHGNNAHEAPSFL
jgi:hypothetical protein